MTKKKMNYLGYRNNLRLNKKCKDEVDKDWEPENGWFNERGWHPSQIC